MKIAIIGSGIAGNVLAHYLHHDHDLTVFEGAEHIGGHTHTHAVTLDGEQHQIDTGFIVFNERSGLEYNGTSLNRLFAQRRNLLRPSFHRMLRDILRFNREAPTLLDSAIEIPLGGYLAQRHYPAEFIRDYLIPMGAAIWSTDPARMLAFPARYFVRFFHNHGMLSVNDRPPWRAIRSGSARYVEKLVAPFRQRIRLNTPVESVRRMSDRVMIQARGVARGRRGTTAFRRRSVCRAPKARRRQRALRSPTT